MKGGSDEVLRKKSHHKSSHSSKNSDSELSDEDKEQRLDIEKIIYEIQSYDLRSKTIIVDQFSRKHKESMFEKVKRKFSTMKM